MDTNSVTFTFFLIFSGAAVLASIALYTRQPLLIAYIALGALLGQNKSRASAHSASVRAPAMPCEGLGRCWAL